MSTNRSPAPGRVSSPSDVPTITVPVSEPATEARVADLVETGLRSELERVRQCWDELAPRSAVAGAPVDLPGELLRFVMAGGKRVRPRMCYWGWVAAGAGQGLDAMVDAAVALELLHCFGLVQDDVMDASATRRGAPSLHIWAAARHRETASFGEADRFGESIAVLVSDLALTVGYGTVMRLPPRMWDLWQQMMIELIAGQSLDLLGAAGPGVDVAAAADIATAKTGNYTVTRPLQLGALAAGGSAAVLATLEAFGSHVGLAFALRDDLLSVIGDPSRTGKPSADDLRDRKPTVLSALARLAGLTLPTSGVEQPGELARFVEDLRAHGIVDQVEVRIDHHLGRAAAVLDPEVVGKRAHAALSRWAHTLANRQH